MSAPTTADVCTSTTPDGRRRCQYNAGHDGQWHRWGPTREELQDDPLVARLVEWPNRPTRRAADADPLTLLNLLREAADDHLDTEGVSGPGASEPGEFYVTFRGRNYAVRVEAL